MKIALASARIVDRDISYDLSQMEYCMKQAKLCCGNTLYVNSICDGDAFGGAAHFLGGKIEVELPIFRNGILYVMI